MSFISRQNFFQSKSWAKHSTNISNDRFCKMNELYSQEIELNKLVCKLKYGRYCVVQDKYKKKVSMKNEDTSMIIFFQ